MHCERRTLLGAGVLVGALAACGGPPGSAPVSVAKNRPDYADPVVETLRRYLVPTPDHPDHPSYAGAVVLVAVDGEVTVHEAVGDALRYGAGAVELPERRRVPMNPDSIFDLASITKLFTSILALQLVDQGRIAIEAPVAEYLPGFAEPAVTVGMLLAHTSGLPDYLDLGKRPTMEARLAALRGVRVKDPAGTVFRYSDVGLQLLGLIAASVLGKPLDAALSEQLLDRLGLRDTYFNPSTRLGPADLDRRMVATEAKQSRGLVRGVVHDENAFALGGVAGHAGLFATAMDVAVIGQLMLNGGEYGGTRILAAETVRRALTDANPGLPARDPENRSGRATHGLGFELNQAWYMGKLAGPRTYGHTGFTGTSLVVEPARRLVLVLLTNRVHPDREWGGVNPTRTAVADVLAEAIAPRWG
jgi:CubicO group peptidase (beta-lactamase class C family)